MLNIFTHTYNTMIPRLFDLFYTLMVTMCDVLKVVSMRTIEDKLRRRQEIVSKRRVLEATLACIEKLDLAEEVVLLR